MQGTERTHFYWAILVNLRAITPKSFKGSGWLSNLAEIYSQQTFSQSWMMIHRKIFNLQSGHGLFWQSWQIQGT